MGVHAKLTYPSKAQINRIITIAKEAGVSVGGVEVSPDGTIRVLAANSNTGSAYERWKNGQTN